MRLVQLQVIYFISLKLTLTYLGCFFSRNVRYFKNILPKYNSHRIKYVTCDISGLILPQRKKNVQRVLLSKAESCKSKM